MSWIQKRQKKCTKEEPQVPLSATFTAERHSEVPQSPLRGKTAAERQIEEPYLPLSEIQVCANIMNNKAPLGHPSLITHLCELARVNISPPPFERPRKAIDEAYYRQYCGGDKATHPVPPRRPRRGRGPPQDQASIEPQEAEPFQMRDMYMSLIDARMQSIHRGWTMDEFHNVVAWPEEQAQGSRAGATEALAMDDDDDEDAFEDAEDDEEEEDSDDSMG
ncbi:hypothetical protein LR48_Vigan05g083600 [Vigna angularis]|uniref:Uncharacterized protein n=1 Tax=Phaseolus angularis TaxID=3914 RepID=A0A0L9UKY3_PHAAN|nr:hypothetical protein LR48_Vigan05g083600 [Vigna angularis]